MVKDKSTGSGQTKRRSGRLTKRTILAELLRPKDTNPLKKTRAKKISVKIIPDIIKEANDKSFHHLKESKKGTESGIDCSDGCQKQASFKLKTHTEIPGVVPSKIVYLQSGSSNAVKAIQLIHNAKQDNQGNAIKNTEQGKTKRIISIEENKCEIQTKNKSGRKQSIPSHYLKASDDNSSPRWRGPLRNYSRVKASSDAQSFELTTTGSTHDKPIEKGLFQNHSLVKNSDSETDTFVSNFSEICEKLANAGSSITDSISPKTPVYRVIKSEDEKHSPRKIQVQKKNSPNASSKTSPSTKIRVSFVKSNCLSNTKSSSQASDSEIKSNRCSVSPPNFQKDSEKVSSTDSSSVEKPASSSVQVKPVKSKSAVSKSSESVAPTVSSKELEVYSYSSLKKSAAAKSSDSSDKLFCALPSRKVIAANVENCNHEDASIAFSDQSLDQGSLVSGGHSSSSSLKRPAKKTSPRKRSFDESEESMDHSPDANAALTKYFADPDFHFLMSLMPFLKKMNLSDRLKARIKIQEVIYDVGNFER